MKTRKTKTLDYIGAYRIMIQAANSDDDMEPEDAERMIAFEEYGEVEPSWTERYEHTIWDLKKIPLKDVWVNSEYYISDEKVDEYASLPARDAPPILIGKTGHPLDGQHRVLAAKKRGDKTILAWVPRK